MHTHTDTHRTFVKLWCALLAYLVGTQMPVPDYVQPPTLKDLLTDMTAVEADARPSLTEVQKRLLAVHTALLAEGTENRFITPVGAATVAAASGPRIGCGGQDLSTSEPKAPVPEARAASLQSLALHSAPDSDKGASVGQDVSAIGGDLKHSHPSQPEPSSAPILDHAAPGNPRPCGSTSGDPSQEVQDARRYQVSTSCHTCKAVPKTRLDFLCWTMWKRSTSIWWFSDAVPEWAGSGRTNCSLANQIGHEQGYLDDPIEVQYIRCHSAQTPPVRTVIVAALPPYYASA